VLTCVRERWRLPNLVKTASGGRWTELQVVPRWQRFGELDVSVSSKTEIGGGGELGGVLTGDGDGRRWPNFEAAVRRRRWSAELRASGSACTVRERERERRGGASCVGARLLFYTARRGRGRGTVGRWSLWWGDRS
jgi:hypothetical protein